MNTTLSNINTSTNLNFNVNEKQKESKFSFSSEHQGVMVRSKILIYQYLFKHINLFH